MRSPFEKSKRLEEIIGIALLAIAAAIYIGFITYNIIPATKTMEDVEVTIESCEKVRAKNNDKNTLVTTTEYITVLNHDGTTYSVNGRWAYNECVNHVNGKANATLTTLVYPNGRVRTYIESLRVKGD